MLRVFRVVVAIGVALALSAGCLGRMAPSTAPAPGASASMASGQVPSPASPLTSVSGPPAPAEDHAPVIVYEYGPGGVNILTLDAFTGERTAIGRLRRGAEVAGQSIRWSADRRSAFVYGDSDSLTARVDVAAGTVASLAGLGPSPSRDAVSPLGDRLARLTNDNDIEVISLTGKAKDTVRLPDGIRPLLRIVWSLDGSTIAVSTCLPCEKKSGDRWQVLLAPLDGGRVRVVGQRITDYIAVDAWAPDGSRLLVENSVCAADPCTGGIGIIDLTTGATSQLTGRGETGASWSPDGDRIAFVNGFGGPDLSVMDLATDPVRRDVLVTAAPGFGIDDPVWSPNGDWILYRLIPFQDFEQTGIGDLWMVPSSGGEPRLVLQHAIADW